MTEPFDASDTEQLLEGIRAARRAIAAGELVVTPTDTVYGLAADAFSAAAVQKLLDAKGRTRQSPPPVLIPSQGTVRALADDVPDVVFALAEKFWPGALTIVVNARPSLDWDLGETQGTVALRVPDNLVVHQLLEETGPLAVSSANLHGQPPATSVGEAKRMLGDSVSVYLDGGDTPGPTPSTILDATRVEATGELGLLRLGALSVEELSAAIDQATGVTIK